MSIDGKAPRARREARQVSGGDAMIVHMQCLLEAIDSFPDFRLSVEAYKSEPMVVLRSVRPGDADVYRFRPEQFYRAASAAWECARSLEKK